MSPPIKNLTPSRRFAAIVPHDTTEQKVDDRPMRAVYVGGIGNVVVLDDEGTTTTFTAVPVGTVLPISGVITTASTATLMVGIYE
jgi:hypothetical protein